MKVNWQNLVKLAWPGIACVVYTFLFLPAPVQSFMFTFIGFVYFMCIPLIVGCIFEKDPK